MRKDSTKFILPILCSFFVIIPTVIFAMVQVMNATKFALRSGYAGYELGYQPVILEGKYFCTADTTKPEQAIFDGDLTRSEEYVVDESTHQVTSKDSKLLKKGRYDIEVYTKDQSDRESLLISVFDRLSPIVYCEYDPLKIPDTTEKTLSKYIFVSDYDEDITINVYKENNVLYFIVVDSSGNKTIKEVNYKITKNAKDQTPIPEIEGMSVKADQFNLIGNKEDYNEVIEEANKLHDRLIKEEEQLQKRLLKEDYEDYKAEEEEKHREFKKQQQEAIAQNKPISKPVVVKPSKPENKEDSSEASKEEEKENTNSSISSEQIKPTEPNTNRPNTNNSNSNNNSQNSSSITRPTRPDNNEQEKPNKPKPVQPTESTACEIPKGYLTTKDENKVKNTNGFLITWKEATKCGKRVYKPIVHEGVFKTDQLARDYQTKINNRDRVLVDGQQKIYIDSSTIETQQKTIEGKTGHIISFEGVRTELTPSEKLKWTNKQEIAKFKNAIETVKGYEYKHKISTEKQYTLLNSKKINQLFLNNLIANIEDCINLSYNQKLNVQVRSNEIRILWEKH